MSITNEKSIRTIQFSGKTKDWKMWSKKFLALSGKREYKAILSGTTKPPSDSEILDLSTDAGKTKLAARKANDNAYHDLVLANQTKIAFNIVDKSVSTYLPGEDAFMAWENLKPTIWLSMVDIRGEITDTMHSLALQGLKNIAM